MPLPSTKKASPSVSSRDREDTREVEQSSDVASLREAVASLQRARVALGQEKADAEARAAAAERQVEELVAKMEMETGRADAAEARGRQLEAQVAEQQAGAHWSLELLKQHGEQIEMEKGRADAAEVRGRELEAAVYNYVQRQH